MYTAGRTAELTGVPRETLRKWEQRYGVVQPTRSEGNYRLYDDEAVRRLAAMRDLVDSGWSPRDAARHVLDEPATATVAGLEAPGGSPHEELDELAAAGEDFDVVRVEDLLDKAFAEADLATTVDEWLLPSLVRLGEAWQRGAVSVAGEHFVSAAVVRRISHAFQQLPHAPAGAPRVMVGLVRGSRHELGVLAFALVMRSRGMDVAYLGADLPVEAWVDTARTLQPAAVVLSAPTVEDLPAVREAAQAIAPHAPVFLGGAQQHRVDGAEPLGHRIGEAAAELAARLGDGG
ncbi:DNA-binding transcriptional MerR regulator/methylmalonyl-CoA mutase cobalamin-binding subunit [Nocardioides cavernae]|uniref:DNA-binding transcriptional MerR regulator/methylmalonyl-CoA mutase cobalamin-binding subunit n=1 Tax=Nocardioides cavernae TaxID=1921566 RepID=A0A7Y9GZX2_9ACTN|nr:MerR family transcriptional regulator [Nocardioides cavernae]NYE35421.1 DNA-binding transcriptional MerR regulator/methylmalonyl-CoA mutase cobalamin-binding subunit [Nocardioides cavernae]